MVARRIGVVFHEGARRSAPDLNYCIWPLAEAWRAAGFEVDALYGPAQAACDVLLMHVDLTVVPLAYRRASECRARVVLNRGGADVSKRIISDLAVVSPEQTSGPVIVKSQLNHGGRPEVGLGAQSRWTRLRRRWVRRGWLGYGFADTLDPHDYRVFESTDQVPRAVWGNRALAVERFLPERVGDRYSIQSALFLGDRVWCHRLISTLPIVRTVSSERVERVDPPDGLRAVRERVGLDYGKIDYVEHDGVIHVIDATRTPCVSRPDEERVAIAQHLAPGLHGLLAYPRAAHPRAEGGPCR